MPPSLSLWAFELLFGRYENGTLLGSLYVRKLSWLILSMLCWLRTELVLRNWIASLVLVRMLGPWVRSQARAEVGKFGLKYLVGLEVREASWSPHCEGIDILLLELVPQLIAVADLDGCNPEKLTILFIFSFALFLLLAERLDYRLPVFDSPVFLLQALL